MSKNTISEERQAMKKKVFKKIRDFLTNPDKKYFKTEKYLAILTSQSRVKFAPMKKEILPLVWNIFGDVEMVRVDPENADLMKIPEIPCNLPPEKIGYDQVLFGDDEDLGYD